MSPRKRNAVTENNAQVESDPSAAEKIARLLALIVTKDLETDEAALKLDSVGFGAGEISDLLGVGSNYVNVAKHRKKRAAKRKLGKRKKR